MTQPLFLGVAAAGYAGAAVFAARRQAGRAGGRSRLSAALTLAGIAAQTLFVALRTCANGFLPFASRFEAMLLCALAVASAGLVTYLCIPRRPVKAVTDGLSALLIGVVLLRFGFEAGTSLNPVLNSPWFAGHILLAFAGYGALVVGCVWSIVALFDREVAGTADVPRRLALAVVVLLGAGILTGAMWADDSWGTYWNWDPKESWALLTWGVMVAFLHLARPGAAGQRPRRWVAALCFCIGLLSMLFTFIGINLLRWGMHRY